MKPLIFYLMTITSLSGQAHIIKDSYQECREDRQEILHILTMLKVKASVTCVRVEQ